MVDCIYQKWPHVILWFTCALRVLVIPLKAGSVFPSQQIWLGFYDLWIKWGRSDSVWKMSISYKRWYSFCQALSLSLFWVISLWSLEPPRKSPAAPKLLSWEEHVKRTSRWKDVSEGPQLFQFNQLSQPKCQMHVWGSLRMSPFDSLSWLSHNLTFPEYCLTILCLYLPKMATCYFLVHMHFQSIGYLPKGGGWGIVYFPASKSGWVWQQTYETLCGNYLAEFNPLQTYEQ